MLRIHVEEGADSITIRVEGRIAGDGVEELERCCQEIIAQRKNCRLVIELDEVLSIDGTGRTLLQRMYKDGVALRGRGLHSQDVVEQLRQPIAS